MSNNVFYDIMNAIITIYINIYLMRFNRNEIYVVSHFKLTLKMFFIDLNENEVHVLHNPHKKHTTKTML